jgi:hypothetical protein
VVAVVVAAAIARFWALDQGLPFPMSRPDEREALEHTVGFGAGDLNPHWLVYPNLFFWVVWLWEELLLAVRRVWIPTPSYTTLLVTDMPRLLLYGRALSALVGTATVALLYVVGARTGGRRLGLLAAALLAGNFLHARDSHALKSESFVTLGMLAAAWLVARWVEAPRPRRAVLAGVAIGVAAGLKYPGMLLLIPAWLADARYGGRTGWRRWLPSGQLVLVAATALLAFAACSPFLLVDMWTVTSTAAFVGRAVYASRPGPPATGGAIVRFLGERSFGYHLTVSLRHGFGLLFALAAPVAVARGFRRGTAPLLALVAPFCVVYYLAIGASPVLLARYLTPIAPLLALLVASLVLALADRAGTARARTALAAAGAIALLVEPVASIAAWGRIAARTDTRVLATRWMAEHLPPGAVVAELGTIVFPISDPELPPGIVRAPIPLFATDLERWNVEYVVTHEHQLPFSKLIPRQMQTLTPRLRPLATFSPYRDGPAGGFETQDAYYVPFFDFAGVERPGPLVRIYAYQPPAAIP